MSLQDQFTEDLEMFFDLDEFATMHNIEGRSVRLVVDNDQAQRNSLKAPGGVFDGDMLIFVRTADLNGLHMAPDRRIVVDMVPYTITNVNEEAGITQITLLGKRGGFYG